MSVATFATQNVKVLNASFEALGATKMDRALSLVLRGDAEIVESDESRIVRSMGHDMPFPRVIRLLRYVKVPFTYAEEFFSRAGVLRRDNHTCGYCGKKASDGGIMTWDHIVPRSKGGPDSWMNAITACSKCNAKKANRTPEEAEMPLLFAPTIPMKIYFRSETKRRQPKKKKFHK